MGDPVPARLRLGAFFLLIVSLGIPCGPAMARDPDQRAAPADGGAPPQFEDYPATVISEKAPAPVDFENSLEKAWMFRTTLRGAAPHGPNFAGHWTVVNIGCGTACQINFIVDTLSGLVYEGPTSTLGVVHRADSRLLIVNEPDLSTPDMPNWYHPQYWVLDGTEFRQVAGPVFE